MSHRSKNLIILVLAIAVVLLGVIVFKLSYGSYCTPVIKEAAPPSTATKP